MEIHFHRASGMGCDGHTLLHGHFYESRRFRQNQEAIVVSLCRSKYHRSNGHDCAMWANNPRIEKDKTTSGGGQWNQIEWSWGKGPDDWSRGHKPGYHLPDSFQALLFRLGSAKRLECGTGHGNLPPFSGQQLIEFPSLLRRLWRWKDNEEH